MGISRYKLLQAYLPGMASVVNSFESSEVQLEVYRSMMDALNERDHEDSKPSQSTKNSTKQISSGDSGVAHELIDGASIHSDFGDG